MRTATQSPSRCATPADSDRCPGARNGTVETRAYDDLNRLLFLETKDASNNIDTKGEKFSFTMRYYGVRQNVIDSKINPTKTVVEGRSKTQ